jgi:hypothetical protein
MNPEFQLLIHENRGSRAMPAIEKGPFGPFSLSIALSIANQRRLCDVDSLHAEADAALPIHFQHLDPDHIAFLELVADALDTLFGDLGNERCRRSTLLDVSAISAMIAVVVTKRLNRPSGNCSADD